MLGKVDGRWGPCTYFLKDEYVGRSVRNYGEYNPDETEKILELAGDGDGYCLDIGANIGCISQALLANGHKVMAFEPQPEIFKVLIENISSVEKATGMYLAENCALGSSECTVKMPKVYYSEKGNFGGLGIGVNAGRGTYDVLCHTLDMHMISAMPSGIKFMKIDVEGYELEVLRGAYNTIMRDKPVMYIEDDRSDKSYALRKYIREELGYWIEEHKPPLYREKNFFGLERNVWDKNYASHNIICRPC